MAFKRYVIPRDVVAALAAQTVAGAVFQGENYPEPSSKEEGRALVEVQERIEDIARYRADVYQSSLKY